MKKFQFCNSYISDNDEHPESMTEKLFLFEEFKFYNGFISDNDGNLHKSQPKSFPFEFCNIFISDNDEHPQKIFLKLVIYFVFKYFNSFRL